MPKCSYCGNEMYMPFTCKYCKKQFCSEHRLPEKHKCKELSKRGEEKTQTPTEEQVQWVTPREQEIPFHEERAPGIPEGSEIQERHYNPETGETTIRYFMPTVRKPDKPLFGITSPTEILHLIIGISLMFESVFFIFLINFMNYLSTYPKLYLIIIILGGLITIGFIGHELSHKNSSIRLKFWAEFRLIKLYAILTAIIPWFIMPGAVQVGSSKASKKEMGKIALAGPIFNLILGIVFTAIGIFLKFLLNDKGLWWIFGFSAFMNIMLGIFNLIPLHVLDGKKIIAWSKTAWLFTFLGLVGLVLVLFFMPWEGPNTQPLYIVNYIPSDLYLSDSDKLLQFILQNYYLFIK